MCLDSSEFLEPPNAGDIWIQYLETNFHILPCSLFISFPHIKWKYGLLLISVFPSGVRPEKEQESSSFTYL